MSGARELEALRRRSPLMVIAEVRSEAEARLARQQGADVLRLDLDSLLAEPLLLRELRDAILTTGVHERRPHLDALRALIAERARPIFLAASRLQVNAAVGSRPARDWFPGSIGAAAEATGRAPELLVGPLEELRARGGTLGIRGVRWLRHDPELFFALAGGAFDAAAGAGADLTLVLPAVSFGGEVDAARRLLAPIARDGGLSRLSLGAAVEGVRGALTVEAIERAAEFVELDLGRITETTLALSQADSGACLPRMLAGRLLEADPFAELDALVASLIARDRGADRRLRGAAVLRPATLASLEALGATGVVVPAGSSLEVRRLRDGADRRPSSVRAAAFPPLPPEPVLPAALPAEVRPGEFLEGLVAEVERGTLTSDSVVGTVPPATVDALARPTLDARGRSPLSVRLGAAPGAGVGRMALSPAQAEAFVRGGEPCILVVQEVYGEEAAAVKSMRGLISARGGRTSHAALVAANSNVPCVIDEHLHLDRAASTATIGGQALAEGDWLSIDGASGEIHAGRLALSTGTSALALASLLRWADQARRMEVWANADTPTSISAAIEAGATGIGLVRTENMFLEAEALSALRGVILAKQGTARIEALLEQGYAARLAAAGSRPVTFRLLDASLHELLPHDRRGVTALAEGLGLPLGEVARQVDAEQASEPAMSLRSSRLALVRPELEQAQLRAMARAWVQAPGRPLRVLVPMVVSGPEMAAAAQRIRSAVQEIAAGLGREIPLELGAMIETPRAALDAAAIAREVSFFAWGSNDLTQFTLGIARSTFPLMAPTLMAAGILAHDPSATLDLEGPGRLMAFAEQAGRSVNLSLHTGVCGNLGADPRSIAVFEGLGMDYVSVPPAQVPRARLAAAQARLRSRR